MLGHGCSKRGLTLLAVRKGEAQVSRRPEDSLRGFNCKDRAVARALLLLLSLPFPVQGLSDLAANFLPSLVAGAQGD